MDKIAGLFSITLELPDLRHIKMEPEFLLVSMDDS